MTSARILLTLAAAVCTSLAAQDDAVTQEANLAFQRRLLAALRFPESKTNIGELIPSNEEIWALAKKVKSPGGNVRTLFGKAIPEGQDHKSEFSRILEDNVATIRRFCFRHDIDVQSEPQSIFFDPQNSMGYLILRYPGGDLVVATRKLIHENRIFIGKAELQGYSVSKGNSAELTGIFAPTSLSDLTVLDGLWGGRTEFEIRATVESNKGLEREDALGLFRALCARSQMNRDAVIEVFRKANDSLDMIKIPTRGKLATEWLYGLKVAETLKIVEFGCRLTDDKRRAEVAALEAEEERWRTAPNASPEAIKELAQFAAQIREKVDKGKYDDLYGALSCASLREKWESLDALAKALMIKGYSAQNRDNLLAGLKILNEADCDWRADGNEARACVDLKGEKLKFLFLLVKEEGEWKIKDMSFRLR